MRDHNEDMDEDSIMAEVIEAVDGREDDVRLPLRDIGGLKNKNEAHIWINSYGREELGV